VGCLEANNSGKAVWKQKKIQDLLLQKKIQEFLLPGFVAFSLFCG